MAWQQNCLKENSGHFAKFIMMCYSVLLYRACFAQSCIVASFLGNELLLVVCHIYLDNFLCCSHVPPCFCVCVCVCVCVSMSSCVITCDLWYELVHLICVNSFPYPESPPPGVPYYFYVAIGIVGVLILIGIIATVVFHCVFYIKRLRRERNATEE